MITSARAESDLPLLAAIAGPSDSGKGLYHFRALGG